MGSGTAWNLTDDRVKKCMDMFKLQHTIKSVAQEFGIKASVLSAKLIDAGIEVKVVRNNALIGMRAAMFNTVNMIEDDAKRSEAMGKYLDRYSIVEDDVDDVVSADGVDVVALIKAELDG